MEMMLDKKQIQAIFLFEFKIGRKAAETIYNLNNTFAPRIANKQCSAGSRSFAKERRALKMRSIVAGHQKLTTTNWDQPSKLILLQRQEKLPKNSASTILWSFGIWSKLERWKSLIKGCLRTEKEKKKNCHFEVSSSLILWNNNKPLLIRIVICNEKWIL